MVIFIPVAVAFVPFAGIGWALKRREIHQTNRRNDALREESRRHQTDGVESNPGSDW